MSDTDPMLVAELGISMWEWRQKAERLEKELKETKELLEGANLTCKKIADLVGDRGQYRDLVEAVEIKLTELRR